MSWILSSHAASSVFNLSHFDLIKKEAAYYWEWTETPQLKLQTNVTWALLESWVFDWGQMRLLFFSLSSCLYRQWREDYCSSESRWRSSPGTSFGESNNMNPQLTDRLSNPVLPFCTWCFKSLPHFLLLQSLFLMRLCFKATVSMLQLAWLLNSRLYIRR